MALQYSSTQRVRVWTVVNKGKYGEVQFSSGRKDKRDGEEKWVNSPRSFVRFVYKAFEQLDELIAKVEDAGGKGVTIVLTNAHETNETYQKDGQPVYAKSPQITVFDFEFFDAEDGAGKAPVASKTQGKLNSVDDEDTIPF